MWELVNEYAKPVGIVILGIFGAKLLENVGKKAIGTVVNLGQAVASKVTTEAAAPPVQPSPPAAVKPIPANPTGV